MFVVKADNAEIDNVLEYVQSDMEKHQLSQTARSNMLISVGEAFSNIASYAYENGGMATIESVTDDKYYKLIFKDRGKKFNPLTYTDPDLTQSAEERNVGGLGIFMVKQMTDICEYEYTDGCNILTLGIKLSA